MKVPIKTYKDEKFVSLKYNHNYAVSNRGRIYSFLRDRIISGGIASGVRVFSFTALSKVKGAWGTLRKDDARGKVTVTIQRLVAEHFLHIPQGKWIVCHKNYDKLDNRASNLVVVPLEGAMLHAMQSPNKRPRFEGRKINADDAKRIRACIKAGYSYKEIADEFGITDMTVRRIGWGQMWGHLGGPVVGKQKVVKLLPEKVREIRALLRTHPQKKVAKLAGVSPATVAKISTRVSYGWVK